MNHDMNYNDACSVCVGFFSWFSGFSLMLSVIYALNVEHVDMLHRFKSPPTLPGSFLVVPGVLAPVTVARSNAP